MNLVSTLHLGLLISTLWAGSKDASLKRWLDLGEGGYCAHSQDLTKTVSDTGQEFDLKAGVALIHCVINQGADRNPGAKSYRFKIGDSITLETNDSDFWVQFQRSRIEIWNYLGLITLHNTRRSPTETLILKEGQRLPIERLSQRVMAPIKFEMGDPVRQWKQRFQELFRAQAYGLSARAEPPAKMSDDSLAITEPPSDEARTAVSPDTPPSSLISPDPTPKSAPTPSTRHRLFDPQRIITPPLVNEKDRKRKSRD